MLLLETNESQEKVWLSHVLSNWATVPSTSKVRGLKAWNENSVPLSFLPNNELRILRGVHGLHCEATHGNVHAHLAKQNYPRPKLVEWRRKNRPDALPLSEITKARKGAESGIFPSRNWNVSEAKSELYEACWFKSRHSHSAPLALSIQHINLQSIKNSQAQGWKKALFLYFTRAAPPAARFNLPSQSFLPQIHF